MSTTTSGAAESTSASTSASTGTGSRNTGVSTTSLTQSIEKLDGAMATGQSNYNAWRFRIIRILKEKDLLSAIEDSDTPISSNKDDQAFTIITLNIKDSQIPYIQDATNTKEAWSALKEVHQGIGMNGRMVLMQRLWGLRMSEGEDMAQHLNLFREIANQLRSLTDDGKGMDDTELVTILTLSLPESYEPLVMALQSRSDTITFDMMAGRLLQEAGRRQISQATNTAQGGTHTQQTAFTVQRPSGGARMLRGRGGYAFNGKGRGGFRPRFRDQATSGAHKEIWKGTGLTSNQVPNGSKCYHCGKGGHWKKDCYKRKAEEASGAGTGKNREFTFLAEDPECLPGSNWIIDSGASQHLSCHRTEFLTYKTVSQSLAITIADGTKIEAYGIGDMEITTEIGVIRLTDVWHVPNIASSLISVTRMVDAGFTVEFGGTACYISNGGPKTKLGHRNGSLYQLSQVSFPPTIESNSQNRANLGLATNQSPNATLETWHRRLCHRTLDTTTLRYLSSKGLDLNVSAAKETIPKICGICALGRQHKEAETKARERATELLQVIHTDLCGPMQTPTLKEEKYFITFTDEMSGRVSICLLKSKDGALAAFEAYRARAEKTSGREIKSLRSDGGGEYVGKRFQHYLQKAGIQHIVSPPYSPAQNGLAERMNRTIMENARCLLQDSKLGMQFWGEAVLTAAHIHNRLPTPTRKDLSPIAHWTGKEPGLGHLRVFGATAWVHIPKERRHKLDAKSTRCILVGYDEDAGSKVYRLYEPLQKRILRSRDVIIDESATAEENTSSESLRAKIGWEPDTGIENLKISETTGEKFFPMENITPTPTPTTTPTTTPTAIQSAGVPDNIQDKIVLRPPLANIESSKRGDSGPQDPGLRRSERNRRREEMFSPAAHFALMVQTDDFEPQTLTDALNSAEKDKWKNAWEEELSSLAKNNTWVLEPLPAERTAIGCRWLFRKKDDGRYKARLVAKGYSQKLGVDYGETFAPVAKFTTIRVLLALCCQSNWEIRGMDVKTAFLNSELEETVYMEVPEGVTIPTKEILPEYQQPMACRLLKSIYGLKQSPRAWYGRIEKFFRSNNFIRSESDHSLFINYEQQVILLLYVDDLVLAAPTTKQIDWIRFKLHREFEMTDLGELKTFLGLEINRNRPQRILHLSQTKYIRKILEHNGMAGCNPTTTPADPHIRLQKSEHNFEASQSEKKQYQSAVGSLMYAMLGTRPDIAYAVSKVSQYSTNPNPTHWTAVKRIFRYLAGTPNRGLYYVGQGLGSGYTDADWGGGDDRKSIGGYTFLLNGSAISWNSKKQSTVALSSTEAEYMALTQAVKESIWLQGLLLDLGAQKHVDEIRNINVDNQGALALARNAEFHARTKHIDIQYHFVRQHTESGKIHLTYCPTTEMTADIFTKPLPQPAFTKHNLGLGLLDHTVMILQHSEQESEEMYHQPEFAGEARSSVEGRCYFSPELSGDESDSTIY